MAKDDFEKQKPEDRLGNQPVDPRMVEMMKQVVRGLDKIFNGEKTGDDRPTGFVLMVFPYNNRDGRTNYMSNGANRQDVVRMMEEQIMRFRTDSDDDGKILEAMADGIADIYQRHNERPMLDDAGIALAAAAVALTIYRKGPPGVGYVGGERIEIKPA